MADPFSLAAGAFGIVSLGITSCKELSSIIGHVKNSNTEMSQITDWTDKLADHLERLQSVVNKVQVDSTAPGTATTATDGIIACATALQNIKAKLPLPLNIESERTSLRRVQIWKRRLLYPFQRGELMFLNEMVQGIQQNLTTALQALQIDLQRLQFESTADQLAQLSDIVIFGNTAVHEEVSSARSDIRTVQATINPLATRVDAISSNLSVIVASVNRLNDRIFDSSSLSFSPNAIHQSSRNLRRVRRRVDNMSMSHAVLWTGSTRFCRCKATTHSTTINWPLQFFWSSTATHDPDCPFSTFQAIQTRLQIRLSICGFHLWKKAQITIDLFRRGEAFPADLTLRVERIVTNDSPGFALIRDFAEHGGETAAGKEYFRKLLSLFQEREASPYDRTEDGETLLHWLYLFPVQKDAAIKVFTNYTVFSTHLLQYMGPMALERNKYQRNCVDVLHGSQYGLRRPELTIESCKELYVELISSGIPPSFTHEPIERWTHLIPDITRHGLWEDFDLSNGIISILLNKSEEKLRRLIADDPSVVDLEVSGYRLLEQTTLLGWRIGCEVLVDNGASIALGTKSQNLYLTKAVLSQKTTVLRFWLETRENATEAELGAIGTLEDAFLQLLRLSGPTKAATLLILVNSIALQRQSLKNFAQLYLPSSVALDIERLPDAQAVLLFESLLRCGMKLSPSLRPVGYSIYHLRVVRAGPVAVQLADALWEAGFKDIEASDFDQGIPSPLIWNSVRRNLSICQWLICKGAKMREPWPTSSVTVYQCLGFALGIELTESLHFSQYGRLSVPFASFLPTFKEECCDECHCPCSSHGCTFMTSFVKGTAERPMPRRMRRLLLLFVTKWTAPTLRQNRSLVTALLRSLTFWQLGLRHTCCDINKIRISNGAAVSPTPRYSPEHLEIIRKEDDFLRCRLDGLVKSFDTDYDRRQEDIVDFIMGYWSEQMLHELNMGVRLDAEEFGEGRRVLGVVVAKQKESTSWEDMLAGNVDLDEWPREQNSVNGLSIRSLIPSVHTLDDLEDVFYDAPESQENEQTH